MFNLKSLFSAKQHPPPLLLPDHLHLPSPDAVFDVLEKRLEIMFNRAKSPRDLGGRYYAWYWGYLGRAVHDLALTTQEDRYHHLMHKSCMRMLALRDDQRGIIDDIRKTTLPGWSAQIDGVRTNEITVLGLVCLPLVEYALATGDRIIAQGAIEALDCLTHEALQIENGAIWFRHPLNGIPEAINHANLYGAALAHGAHLPDAPSRFATIALGIDQWFRQFQVITRHRRTRTKRVAHWPYSPGPKDQAGAHHSEAIWKAGASIELPIALAETSFAQTDSSLDPITAIITGNPLVQKGEFPLSIDPRVERTLGAKYEGSNLPAFLAAWFQIGDDELDDTILRLMAQHSAKFHGGWTVSNRTMMMGLAHLIKTNRIPPALQTGPDANAWAAYFRNDSKS